MPNLNVDLRGNPIILFGRKYRIKRGEKNSNNNEITLVLEEVYDGDV